MTIDRRTVLTGAAALPLASWAERNAIAAPPPPRNSLNAIALGVRSGAEQDQSKARAELKDMCEKLLANTIIEKYEIELKA